MHIQSTAPAKPLSKHTVTVQTKDSTNVSVQLNLVDAKPSQIKTNKKEGDIAPLLTKGTSLGLTYKAGSYVIDGIRNANVNQVSKLLQDYHFVETSSHAENQAKRLLDFAQSKGSSALLLGAHMGVLTVVAVDLVKPNWPFSRKLIIGLIIMALVSSLAYFGIQDEPELETSPVQVISSD
ncbi:hypothetical protein [Rheinheimera salexigens]|uniref:Uncharacterized protein n=1 Tax=Rheinheimera salexigens TaxID=1628148 RepID=A0A1E7Q6D1_9GAMM|nr:hypothetical protein [Rheinheimera salexigens]OEY69661.1 hypothetical protein BI198_08905 [Rheinheimera salexigens]